MLRLVQHLHGVFYARQRVIKLHLPSETSDCITDTDNDWYRHFKCEYQSGDARDPCYDKSDTPENVETGVELLIVAEHDAFLPWLEKNGVIIGWTVLDSNGQVKYISARILTTNVPSALRSGFDPSNPCHAAATTYAGYVRTAITGDPVLDNVTATWASTLMTYNLAGLKPTFRWVNCDDIGFTTEFCLDLFGKTRRKYDDTYDGSEALLFDHPYSAFYSTQGHSRTGLGGKFEQLFGPKPYPVISFETKTEIAGSGPFHNSVFHRVALKESLMAEYKGGDLVNAFYDMDIGSDPDSDLGTSTFPTLSIRGIHQKIVNDWQSYDKPFEARYNNEYITFSYELVTPPTLELGCDVHTAVFKNEDFSSGMVRKDISPGCAPPQLQRASLPQQEFVVRDAPCYCAINFYPGPEAIDNNWLFGPNGMFEGATPSPDTSGIYQGSRVTVFLVEYEFGYASRATMKDSKGWFQERLQEGDVFGKCYVTKDQNRRCPRSLKHIDLDTVDAATRKFFVSHRGNGDIQDNQLVQNAITEAMKLQFGRTETDYTMWEDGDIPPCPLNGDDPVSTRICLGTSYDPLAGGIGVETDFTFTANTLSRMHPLAWSYCSLYNGPMCKRMPNCFYDDLTTLCVPAKHKKFTYECMEESSEACREAQRSKLQCDVDPDDTDCWERETSFGTKCMSNTNEWNPYAERTGLHYDYSINSVAVQFMAAQRVGGSLSRPIETTKSEPRTPFTRGHKSRFPSPQLVPDDYKLRPYTPGSSDTSAKQVCRCGPKPVYACIVYTPLWWAAPENLGVDELTIGDKVTGAKIRNVNVRKCGWSWGGLGAVGIAGDTGLYMGSDFTNIEIAERDILNDSATAKQCLQTPLRGSLLPTNPAYSMQLGMAKMTSQNLNLDPKTS